MFGKYNGFVSKARVSACMYFLVFVSNSMAAKVKIVGGPTVFSGAIGTPKYSHRDKKTLKAVQHCS
jgi:hypothetical protein